VLDFATHTEQPDFTHAWFPAAEFDETRVEGSLALARSGRGAALLRGSARFEPVTHGPSAGAEIRQYGRKTRWVVRVCEAPSLDAAESRFAALAVHETGDGALVVEDPDYGTVRFRPDGAAEAEGRLIDPARFTVPGEAVML
jgi:hypothetical protein